MLNSSSTQTQVASEISDRLRALTDLESVHVIPIERIGLQATPAQNSERSIEPFSERLGAFAADFVAYEMAFAMFLKVLENRHPENEVVFKVGVAAGSTVRAIVEDFRIPEILCQSLAKSRLKILVSPLAIGPIPETASSAGFIASNLSLRMRQSLGSKVEFDPLAEKTPSADGYELRMVPAIRKARDEDPGELLKSDRDRFRNSWMRFDWILTGVGSIQTGQLVEHLRLRFGEPGMGDVMARDNVIGDICSRMYDYHGQEEHKVDGDKFVGISYRWLQFLATMRTKGQRSHTVVAVTGGEDKYDAIYALIKNTKEELRAKKENRCPFNSLVTDELTARRLIRDLHKGEPGLNSHRSTKKPGTR